MKKLILTLLLGGFIMTGLSAKTAFVYFSATGTTERMAKNAAEAMGADILEIQPVHKYTDADLDWRDKNHFLRLNVRTRKAVLQLQTKSTFQAMTPLRSAIQSGGLMRQKLFTTFWKARTGMAKSSSLFVPAVEAVLVAAEVTLQNLLKARTLKAEKILPEEVAQMLRNILKDC